VATRRLKEAIGAAVYASYPAAQRRIAQAVIQLPRDIGYSSRGKARKAAACGN
jgi:hypothetical protein